MTELHIDLQEGFSGDRVVVRVDGREVFSEAGVRTDYAVGLAERIRTEVSPEDGDVEVEVEVPTRSLGSRERHRLDPGARVVVRITPDGRLEQESSERSPELF